MSNSNMDMTNNKTPSLLSHDKVDNQPCHDPQTNSNYVYGDIYKNPTTGEPNINTKDNLNKKLYSMNHSDLNQHGLHKSDNNPKTTSIL